MAFFTSIRSSSHRRTAAILASTLGAALMLSGLAGAQTSTAPKPAAAAPAAAKPVSGFARVEGTVFDSLAKRIVRGATVWINGTTLTTTTDSTGHYELDSIPAGRHAIAFSAPAFDSAGLGTLGKLIEFKAGAETVVNLASPSLRKLWSDLCKFTSAPGKDSGIVYGTITDGDTQRRLVKAPAIFKWYDMNNREKRVSFAENQNRSESDSTGTFYACGLPTDVSFNVRAYGNKSASGEIEYSLGERSVTRLDFVVSKEFAGLVKTRGTGTLHGVVRDVNGAPVSGAVVTAISADTTARTDEQGEFTLRLLPGGTQGIQVRKIGLGVANKLVDLIPGQTTETSLIMPPARTLATYNVRAARTITMEEADYEDRKKLGFGTFIDFDKREFATTISALINIPRIRVEQGRNGAQTISMFNGTKLCSPYYYLNGTRVDAEQMRDYPVNRIRSAEVYTSAYNLPARFIQTGMNPCGVVIYWTKDRW